MEEGAGAEYEGGWAEDLRQGQGRQTWRSGDVYEGGFHGGAMHGQVTRT